MFATRRRSASQPMKERMQLAAISNCNQSRNRRPLWPAVSVRCKYLSRISNCTVQSRLRTGRLDWIWESYVIDKMFLLVKPRNLSASRTHWTQLIEEFNSFTTISNVTNLRWRFKLGMTEREGERLQEGMKEGRAKGDLTDLGRPPACLPSRLPRRSSQCCPYPPRARGSFCSVPTASMFWRRQLFLLLLYRIRSCLQRNYDE